MNHPQIENMQRYGHKSFPEMLEQAIEEGEYVEDIYNEEIKPGDESYIDEYGQLVHEKSLAQWALDHHDFKKITR